MTPAEHIAVANRLHEVAPWDIGYAAVLAHWLHAKDKGCVLISVDQTPRLVISAPPCPALQFLFDAYGE